MKFKEILTDESVIHFVDGTIIKGAEAVGEVILNCCKAYTKGYLIGIVSGCAIVVVSGLSIKKIIKYKKKNFKKREEA